MIRHLASIVFAALTALSLNAWAAVDVNKASQAELETIKGIGPALSGKILDARKTSTFKDWGDLVERVVGIGPGNAARLSQAGLTVGDKVYDGAATPAKAGKADKTEKVAKAAQPK